MLHDYIYEPDMVNLFCCRNLENKWRKTPYYVTYNYLYIYIYLIKLEAKKFPREFIHNQDCVQQINSSLTVMRKKFHSIYW